MDELTAEDIDKIVTERLQHENIVVSLNRTGLRFKIDDREVEQWTKSLTEQGESFVMMNIITEQVVAKSKK